MSTEEHGFKAEVQKLLDLMIHSVYSNRDVFLRELVSNAADALDKVRFVELTEQNLAPSAHEISGVHLALDAEANTLTIADDGIGMTREEAIEHLGTIAHSGSKAFFDKLKGEGAADLPELIGQFGVGFYSSFMVAEQVVVETRSARPDATGVRWTSKGDGRYTVEDVELEHRGTTITLHLREDAAEYAEEHKLRAIVKEHSNFLSWPIHLDEEQVNSGRALWLEQPSQVDDADANELYKSLTFDFEEPALRVHLSVDSPLQYSAMLFVPKSRPYDLFFPDASRGPRLYARRVLIEEHAKDLLPDWLRFVKGVVDSEDIQLNVSREMVQQTAVVRKIRDALTKRLLKELNRFATREHEGDEPHPYDAVWNAFGVLLKEGYHHDSAKYGDRLLPLYRFNTLKHEDDTGLSSLAAYKEAMAEGQDSIWYITAESREAALVSPHLEAFRKRGWDVILLTDTVDEWFVQGLTEFDGVPVKSVSRGELDLEDEDEASEAEKAGVEGLGSWMKGVLGEAVASVRPATRLTESPAVLVDDNHGVSANMERILRQANQDFPGATRHLELNVKHPLIKDLVLLHEKGREATAEPLARLLLDNALLLEGTVSDAPGMGRRMQALLQRAASQAASADA